MWRRTHCNFFDSYELEAFNGASLLTITTTTDYRKHGIDIRLRNPARTISAPAVKETTM